MSEKFKFEKGKYYLVVSLDENEMDICTIGPWDKWNKQYDLTFLRPEMGLVSEDAMSINYRVIGEVPSPDIVERLNAQIMELEKRVEEADGERERFPKIVCLCGSTRFYKQFQEWNYKFTMKGFIVLSVGFYPHAQNEVHGEQVGITPEQKEKLDELHKKKIDLADEIFVINVGGYIGESTRSEIDHAEKTCKPVKYLDPTPGTETPDPENKEPQA